ncbi:hypothetical protein G0U57_002939, partial [Chelydra serpentina]
MEEAPMEQGVKWATELIDQKLEEQERLQEPGPPRCPTRGGENGHAGAW